MQQRQRGNVIVGIIIGMVLGLAAALAVAVYVTKVPVPFVNKGGGRTAEQDAAETKRNQNWDPNAPLYGKNPAKALPPAPGIVAPPPVAAVPAVPAASAPEPEKPKTAEKPADKPVAAASAARPASSAPPAVAGRPPSADPLGDLATARANAPAGAGTAAAGSDPFLYFVQAGAFKNADEAEAQRAKLSLMGIEAKVTEREQAGRQIFRVRVGPFEKKEDADRNKEKLETGGFDTALVRVQK